MAILGKLIAKLKIGNIVSGAYTEFEADGTMVLHGDARVYDDMLFEISVQDVKAHATSGTSGALATVGSGTFESTFKRDGVYWTLDEINGETDDYFIDINAPLVFKDIEQAPVMFWSGQYTGTAAHAGNMSFVVYNPTSGVQSDIANWDALTFTFADNILYNDAIVSGFTTDHISVTGEVKVAILHTNNGATGHQLLLDEIYLQQDNTPEAVLFNGGYVESFRNTGYDTAHGKVQLSHKYEPETDILWHTHFVPLTNIFDGETVIFTISHSFAPVWSLFPTKSTITATFTNDAAWRATLTAAQAAEILSGTAVLAESHLVVAGATTVSGLGLNISAIAMLELQRDVGTHAANVGVLYSDFHIVINTLGSNLEFVK